MGGNYLPFWPRIKLLQDPLLLNFNHCLSIVPFQKLSFQQLNSAKTHQTHSQKTSDNPHQ